MYKIYLQDNRVVELPEDYIDELIKETNKCLKKNITFVFVKDYMFNLMYVTKIQYTNAN